MGVWRVPWPRLQAPPSLGAAPDSLPEAGPRPHTSIRTPNLLSQLIQEQLPRRRAQLIGAYGPNGTRAHLLPTPPGLRPVQLTLNSLPGPVATLCNDAPTDSGAEGAVDASGWTLAGPLAATLPPGAVLPPGACLYVASDAGAARRAAAGDGGRRGRLALAVGGGTSGGGGGGRAALVDGEGRVVVADEG